MSAFGMVWIRLEFSQPILDIISIFYYGKKKSYEYKVPWKFAILSYNFYWKLDNFPNFRISSMLFTSNGLFKKKYKDFSAIIFRVNKTLELKKYKWNEIENKE